MTDLTHLISEAQTDFASSASMNDLEVAKAKYLGKTGLLTDALKSLGKLSNEERPAAGAAHRPNPQGSRPPAIRRSPPRPRQ